MALSLYVGNALKDLVCGPRPFQTPFGATQVKCLGSTHEEARKNAQEYGMPSSHVLNSISFNFYAVHYLLRTAIVSPETAGARADCWSRAPGCGASCRLTLHRPPPTPLPQPSCTPP